MAASEAALEELEEAMNAAEKTQQAATSLLNPTPAHRGRLGVRARLTGGRCRTMAAERLQKYLARAGVASRRHAEELITSGRVTVNNEKVTELGSKVSPGDLVMVDGSLVTPPEESSYFLLYKPVGVVTTLSDPQGRPTVASYIEQTGKRLFPVGRLDYDAEGALLVTDDGALAHKLTHPSFQVPRTYRPR
ncbi:pseudouridine synthase [Cystobacter fuscus]